MKGGKTLGTQRSRKCGEKDFSEFEIQEVWGKGLEVSGWNKNEWRKDKCGAAIRREDYGEQTNFGWEIDHKKPCAEGGTDDIENLQPLQWENNRHKGDDYPKWGCLRKYNPEKKQNT